MTDPRESPHERAAIEKARRNFGPFVQAQAVSQKILGEIPGQTLTSAQTTWLADFRRQIDLDGRLGLGELAYIATDATTPQDICQDRIDAVAAAVRVQLAQAPTAAERARIFQAGREQVMPIRDAHRGHRRPDRIRDDALDVFGAAEDELRREALRSKDEEPGL